MISNKDELTLALLTFLAIILVAISWYKSMKVTLRFPPGPRGLPVVGYLPFLGPNLHHEFTKLAQRYGSIFKLKLGSKTVVVVSSSELAEVVLREQDNIFANRDPPVAGLVISYGGQNIVWSNNNLYWRNLRKLLVHQVLNNKNVQGSSTLQRSEVGKHVYENMGTEVDISRIGFLTSMNVVINMLWGKSLVDEKINKTDVEFKEVISKIVELLGKANLSDFFPVLSRLDLQGVEREMKRQLKTMDSIFETMFESRIKLNASKGKEAIEQEGNKDFLQILLELKDQKSVASFEASHGHFYRRNRHNIDNGSMDNGRAYAKSGGYENGTKRICGSCRITQHCRRITPLKITSPRCSDQGNISITSHTSSLDCAISEPILHRS